jgi:hypothetical protein
MHSPGKFIDILNHAMTANLRCKYHGRMFDLDGKFKSMPEFKGVENFPTKDDDLHELPLFQWGKLLFTTLTKKYKPEVFFNRHDEESIISFRLKNLIFALIFQRNILLMPMGLVL